MADFAILLPSAEGKAPGGNPLAPDMFDYRTSNTFNYFSELNPERRAVIKTLQRTIQDSEEAELEKLFGVKGDTLEEAVQVNLDIYGSPLLAAVDRYGPGVMYQAMEFADLPTGAQRRLLENGVIFSGLFGLLRPDDLIPNYRLKIDAKLPDLGKLSTYWRPLVSPSLNRALQGKFVWDLLPNAHREAWTDEGTYRALVQVKFYDEDESGERKAVTHNVKQLRGALVNFVVRDPAESIEDLEDWEAPGGYEIDHEATTFDEEAKTGTVVMVSSPGWEKRRAERQALREEAAREKAAAKAARAAEAEDDEDDE
jgi:cytoplasmic iron level regulating protein YaaA (DUF328/UPF0246 family)